MAVIHISEADAARDFASLMAHVRAGDEVSIQENGRTVARLQQERDVHEIAEPPTSNAQRFTKEMGFWVLDTGVPLTSDVVNQVIEEVREERDMRNLFPDS